VASNTLQCKTVYSVGGTQSAYPRLSTDTKRILFQTNTTGKWQIKVLDIVSGNLQSITTDTSNNNYPDWNSDNTNIAYVSDRDGNEEIYLFNATDGSSKRITTDIGRDIHPYFSPDSRYILFSSTRGNGSLDIFRYEIATGKTLRLTNTADDETCARYSPDMQHIVYLRNSNTIDDVFVLDVSNFLSENITRTPTTRDGWPMYSPNGKWIYYSSMEGGSYSLYRIKPDGTDKQQLTQAKEGEEDARVFVSNNNSQLIYNRQIGQTMEIMLCGVE